MCTFVFVIRADQACILNNMFIDIYSKPLCTVYNYRLPEVEACILSERKQSTPNQTTNNILSASLEINRDKSAI